MERWRKLAAVWLVGAGLALMARGVPARAGVATLPLRAEARPAVVPPGDTVSYTIALTNDTTADLAGLSITDHLPAGFAYLSGSSALRVDGGLISVADPAVSGDQLTWAPGNLRAAQADWFYGMHTFIQDACDNSHIDAQLAAARDLMGAGAFVKQLFYGIHTKTSGPRDCWVYFVNRAYDLNLQPVVRLQGPYGGSTWIAPAADGPGDYTTIAAAFQRVVAGLPRRDGHNLFVEVWNEPNLNIEWSGAPNPWAYAHFLLDVSRAIRGLGDSRIVILNGGLAPGGDVNHLDFIDGMATVPGALDSFDVWASHPYPANHPPEYNIHDGTATYTVATIDTYMLELDRLAEHGRPGLHVLLTETGHNLGNNVFGFEGYTPVNEGNRADFMVRAFRDYWSVWPEVVGVTPFELVDPHNHWSAFDWLYPNGAHHQQYDAVAALGKSTKLLPTELTITFRVRASMSPGTYFSRVDASAANATVVGTGNTAAVTVLAPTATATATATGTPTATPTATPSPTATVPPCARYDLDGDGAITVTDIMAVAAAWGTNAGEPGYVPEYDFNTNGQIDVFDIMQVAGHWAETCPPGSGEVRAGAFELRESPGLRALAWDQATNRLLGLSRTDLLVLSDDGSISRYPLGQDLRALAIGAGGRDVYVTDAAGGQVLVFDALRGKTVARIDGLSGPTGIVAGGRGVWVSEGTGGRLALVNPRNYGIIRRVPVGAAPGALAYDESQGRLYVLVTGQGTVAVVNDGGTVETIWPVGGLGFPQGMALDAPGGRLYVSYAISSRRGGIAIFDLAHGQRVDTWRGTLFAPLDPLLTLELSPSADQLFAVGTMSWWEIGTRSGSLTQHGKRPGPVTCFGAAVDPRAGVLWIAEPGAAVREPSADEK